MQFIWEKTGEKCVLWKQANAVYCFQRQYNQCGYFQSEKVRLQFLYDDITIVSTSIYVAVAFKQISYVVCGECTFFREIQIYI